VIAGGFTTVASARQAKPVAQASRTDAAHTKEVLITSATSGLCLPIAEKLKNAHRVRLTATSDIDTSFPFTKSDLDHSPSTDALVPGVEAIVHVGLASPGASGTQIIDYRTRATYNLLRAATRQGVRRVVYLSSLEIMLGYDEQYMITEDFRPQPTPHSQTLSHHLGEFTCREFARLRDLDVVVLRLGRLEQWMPDSPFAGELPLTNIRDVTAAVATVVGSEGGSNPPDFGPWTIIHIHSQAKSSRFPLTKAERLLDYRPKPTGANL
jgi:hypothetical protein